MEKILWNPSKERIKSANITKFIKYLNTKGHKLSGSNFHDWSVSQYEEFWQEIINYFEPRILGNTKIALKDKNFIPYSWFPDVQLNFAENLLLKPLSLGLGSCTALHFIHESGTSRKISYDELSHEVARVRDYLEDKVAIGDVVAAYMPNTIETVIVMLATASLGAVFTSTSIDFGASGVLDRFGQTKPKVLVTCLNYEYNGKTISREVEIMTIIKGLEEKPHVLTTTLCEGANHIREGMTPWEELPEPSRPLSFVHLPFEHPLYIMYSSGTTGKPKCIVHSSGGTLLKHICELGLHTDLKEKKKIFFFTTAGWMMWNWLMSSLYFGAEIVLYEGSPTFPSINHFMDIIDKEEVNIWGTGPKFIRILQLFYNEHYKFKHLETILSTGAPLLPEQFDYVYKEIKQDVLLSSICGGTDIIGCFMLGSPIRPVIRGEIQTLAYGLDVKTYSEEGEEIIEQEGELVCVNSFPSCPIGFWNDSISEKFREAYFNRFPNVWHHGDYIRISKDKTVRVFGRSDATLNPGGVRIGTSEIYRPVEDLSFVEDSLVIGKQKKDDVYIVLFIKCIDNYSLTEEDIINIKSDLKKKASPRHVPWKILQVQDIPYTRSGKKMEMLVSKIFQNKEITNLEAISNPQSLEEFRKISNEI